MTNEEQNQIPQVDPQLQIEQTDEEQFEEETSLFERIVESVRDFEASHPFIFFGGIAIVIFFIIYTLISPFLGGSSDEDIPVGTVTEVTETDMSTGATIGINAAKQYDSLDTINALTQLDFSVFNTTEAINSGTFLGPELLIIRQIEEAISVDIQALMAQNTDNERDYDDYLDTLQRIEKVASAKYGDLYEMNEIFAERIEISERLRNEALQTLNITLENGTKEEVEIALEEYMEFSESLAKLEVRHQLTEDILDSFRPPLVSIRARIVGLMANKEIIIQNLTAVDVDDDGLEVIQEGELEEYDAYFEELNL